MNKLFNRFIDQENNTFVYGLYTAMVIFIVSLKTQIRTFRVEMYDTYKKHFSEKGIKHFFKPWEV